MTLSIFPSVIVGNIGDSTETDYYVKLTIFSEGVIEYQDSIAFTSPLASLEAMGIDFAKWVPSAAETFDVEFGNISHEYSLS